MRKNSESFRNSGAYTSPGTPEYGDNNAGEMPKTWSSERVPLPTNISRRHIGAAALMPFNSSGRTLPSKWDDAERWITSPVSGYGAYKTSVAQPQRQPKSKSGPVGPTGLVYLSNYSPTMSGLESGKVRNFMANSHLTTGVLIPDGFSVNYDAGVVGAKSSKSLFSENDMTMSTSVPGLSDTISETSAPSSQDDELEGVKDEEVGVSRDVSRRDMATQMSPEGSNHSSSRGRLSFSALPPSIHPSVQPNGNSASKDEVRDVQVDKGTTQIRQSKKQGIRKMKKESLSVEDEPLPWNTAEASKTTSNLKREEAKISAWENLQKAKAEAAVRKLEMKLEKKRSASMDKIMNRLRTTEMKAQAVRNSLQDRAARTSHREISCFTRATTHSLRNCFPCHRK